MEHRILTMWLAGHSYDAISAEIGISRTRAQRIAYGMGVPKRPNAWAKTNLWPVIVGWAREGWRPEQIADGIGLTGDARGMVL